MVLKKIWFLIVVISTATQARAEVLFDGWYKVLSAGQHVGYVVQRYEYDSKSKTFTSTYFLKTNAFGNSVTEGVKAKATQSLRPVSLQYTSSVGKKTKVIDATFVDRLPVDAKIKAKAKNLPKPKPVTFISATITEDGREKKIDKELPQGSFLSTFLVYLMLQSKEGLQVDKKYDYLAIAEEDAEVYKGSAYVKESVKLNGQDVFKVLNTYKDMQSINYINPKGDVISTKTPSLHLATELVSDMQEATHKIPLDTKSLKFLFGEIPIKTTTNLNAPKVTPPESLKPATSGASAVLDEDEAVTPGETNKESKLKKKTPSENPSKFDSVPPGKGVILKGTPSPTEGE